MGNGEPARPTLVVVVSLVWGILLLPGLLGAALSPMFFDAPGSMNNAAAWINALIVVSFPVLCVLSIAGSWIVWAWKKRSATRVSSGAQIAVACLPLLPVLYVAGVLVVGTVGVLFSGQPLGLHSTIIKH
jgi:hypothetical protein